MPGLSPRHRSLVHGLVVLACCAPAAELAFASWQTFAGAQTHPPPLGANPIESLQHRTGVWALRFLVLALAVTPLRRIGWRSLAPYRRTFGLTSFFYAGVHFAVFVGLDLGFDVGALAEDLRKRPYIGVGFAAFLILTALALTSTRSAMRRLGRRWTLLHRGIYVASLLAVLHFSWLVKADFREPIFYGSCVAVLLAARIGRQIPIRLASRAPAGDSWRP